MITVIVPTYNRSALVQRALKSIIAQTYRPLQLVVVDNKSSDNTLLKLQEIKDEYSNKELQIDILIEERKGASICRNTGLKIARGEYVYFFDSDDEMSSDFLQVAITKMQDTHADIVACVTNMVFNADTPKSYSKSRKYGYSSSPKRQILASLLATQSVFLKKEFINRVGGWNETLSFWNDWELGLRLLLANPKMVWIKNKTYHQIYQHSNSLTELSQTSSIENMMYVFSVIHQDIDKSDYVNKDLLFKSLAQKIAITAGHLYRNKQCKEAKELYQYAKSIHTTISLSPIFFLTRNGLPGIWRFL